MTCLKPHGEDSPLSLVGHKSVRANAISPGTPYSFEFVNFHPCSGTCSTLFLFVLFVFFIFFYFLPVSVEWGSNFFVLIITTICVIWSVIPLQQDTLVSRIEELMPSSPKGHRTLDVKTLIPPFWAGNKTMDWSAMCSHFYAEARVDVGFL